MKYYDAAIAGLMVLAGAIIVLLAVTEAEGHHKENTHGTHQAQPLDYSLWFHEAD